MTEITRLGITDRMSAIVIHGDTIYFKGITARGTGGDITTQTHSVLNQMDALLNEAGSARERLLQMTVWLADMADFAAMNAVYDSWVPKGHQPVRACVQAGLADPSLRIEIRAIAAR
jgi:enamine deaminase RidA (YjgF/YER057c/UK114 family)